MRIEIEVQDLRPGDQFPDSYPSRPIPEAYENAFSIVREAFDTPTRKANHYALARTVYDMPKVARKYVRVTMGTYAIVRRLKGTVVVVDRAEENEPQAGSESVPEDSPFAETPKHGHAGRIQSGYWEPEKNYRPTATLCFCGLAFFGTDTAVADLRHSRHMNEVKAADEYADKPADFEDEGAAASRSVDEIGAGPRKFSYAQSQFAYVEDASEFYRMQISSNNREAKTKWMNITLAQFRAIREILIQGEVD